MSGPGTGMARAAGPAGRESRVGRAFAELSERGERALVAYLAVGDPDLPSSIAAARAMVRAGADILELGVPYSDPLADGPSVQAAGQRALAAGFRLDHLFQAIRELRRTETVPLTVMTYFNPVLQRGVERFAREAAEAGADGMLLPDLPPEEAEELAGACRASGLDLMTFVAPTSTEARRRAAAAFGSGFIYCVSVTGVTGARRRLPPELPGFLDRLRSEVALPVVVGFGVSTPEQARELGAHADGVAVGSALVDEIGRGGGAEAIAERVAGRVRALKDALRGGG